MRRNIATEIDRSREAIARALAVLVERAAVNQKA